MASDFFSNNKPLSKTAKKNFSAWPLPAIQELHKPESQLTLVDICELTGLSPYQTLLYIHKQNYFISLKTLIDPLKQQNQISQKEYERLLSELVDSA